jgi:peptidoglycan hydrolase-like protein with peptidoglycan-binding domain
MRSLLCLLKLDYFQPLILALSLCCVGIIANPSEAILPPGAIAQADETETETEPEAPQILRPGDRGEEVVALQEKLQTLGFFEGELDGDYGVKTETAVAQFQGSQDLNMDGIAGSTTLQKLDDAIAQQEDPDNETEDTEDTEAPPEPEDTGNNRRFLLLGGAVATFILASLGLIVLLSLFSKAMQTPQLPPDSPEPDPDPPEPEPLTLTKSPPTPPTSVPEPEDDLDDDLTEPWFTENSPIPSKFATEPNTPHHLNSASLATQVSPSENHRIEPPKPPEPSETDFSVVSAPTPSSSSLALPAEKALPKLDFIEELIEDLQAPQPDKRRQAIWELAQHADSRAVQPLIGLLIDSDSQQRGLILEALTQIGSRTLKPMNRALTIALQDENAQVRKNAIRDLTQMYELIAKLSKLLYLAVDDPDPEVQETAKWALSQLNNIKIPNFGDKDS